MAGGRPTEYRSDHCERALEYLSQGKSITQLARHFSVNRSTIYQWAKDNEEFSDALETAIEYSQAHWEDELENMMYSKEVNAPLVKLYFANRFRWTDKGEVETEEEKEAPTVNISFEVRESVNEVKVTNAKPE